jgi:hypothetical protein
LYALSVYRDEEGGLLTYSVLIHINTGTILLFAERMLGNG